MATMAELYQLSAEQIAARVPTAPDFLIGAWRADQVPEEDGQLRFLYHYNVSLAADAKEPYSWGSSKQMLYSRETMEKFAAAGHDVLLETPVPARTGERLFLDSNARVWLASGRTPFSDPNIRPVGAQLIPASPPSPAAP